LAAVSFAIAIKDAELPSHDNPDLAFIHLLY
jgi:hypothetical protein